MRTPKPAIFTKEEEQKFIAMYPGSTHREMLAAFPLHAPSELEYFVKKYNMDVKAGRVKGETLRKHKEARYKEVKPVSNELPEYKIPVRKLINFNIYAYTTGYELKSA